MSRPTQAQIEAAAEAMHRYDVEHGFDADGLASAENYLPMATAALTAAAGVGPYTGMQIDKNGLVLKYTDKDLDDTEAATIKRCAGVAEWEGYATVGRQIAAEIRKLKDKP